MNRTLIVIVSLAALTAAGLGGFLIGRRAGNPTVQMNAMAQPTGDPIYYRDPDGRPSYSLTPMKTTDGRDYRAVLASADLNFDTAEETPKADSGPRKIKYYRNPMGLPDTSPVPKKDSMSMDYIPVYEGDDNDDGSVKVSPGKIQRSGVKSEPAAMRTLRTLIRAPGTIQLDERRIAVISMRAESWVKKVDNVTTGVKVQKGDPLMEIYSPAVASAAADYVATIGFASEAKGAAALGKGSRQRLMNLDVPETFITEMEKTRTVPLTVTWTAPRDGIVIERTAVEGMRVQPGDVLFRLADPSVVWTMIDVAERDIGAIAVGQPATVRARSFPGREFNGAVSVIYPLINRETRTARARIELPNPDIALLPDMYIDAEINTGNPQPVLTVPESAVIDTGTKQSVFVDKGKGKLEPREVKLGKRGDSFVEVRSGITDGERIVVSANFLVDAESNLKAALQGYKDAEFPQ